MESFVERYRQRFETELSEMRPILIALRTAVIGRRPRFNLSRLASNYDGAVDDALVSYRRVYFAKSWFDTPVYNRKKIPLGTKIQGPAILEQLDTTTVIEPDEKLFVDDVGNLVVTITD